MLIKCPIGTQSKKKKNEIFLKEVLMKHKYIS